MKLELNLLAAVFNEIESKYGAVKKQLEITADTSIEEGVKSEDKTITENLKSGEENKNNIWRHHKNMQLSKGIWFPSLST